MPGIDEKETMKSVVETLYTMVDAPLCIDSSSPEVIEAALRIYPGRALINSISAEKAKMDKLFPIAAKYGAMFILLPIDENGVPETCEERIRIVQNVFKKAQEFGFDKNDIVVDGLVMTVSSDQNAAFETLKVIDWCSNSFGCNTIVGLSNVSFGLPERKWVNSAFLTLAIGRGLTMAICNPNSDLTMNIKMACDVLTVKDKNSMNYIRHFSKSDNTVREIKEKSQKTTNEKVFDCVVDGDKSTIKNLINQSLSEGTTAQILVDDFLIPAITKVGDLFDKKIYFLPQLIQSAETMKSAFEIVEPILLKDESDKKDKVGVILATVKGDVHDIGKNIVGLMLKNYGFNVYDLGKDVSAEEIIRNTRETGSKIVGLSALMTTTMTEMENVINLAKNEGLECKFMIGGAVVDENYANKIGADGYSKDAYEAVKLAEKLSI